MSVDELDYNITPLKPSLKRVKSLDVSTVREAPAMRSFPLTAPVAFREPVSGSTSLFFQSMLAMRPPLPAMGERWPHVPPALYLDDCNDIERKKTANDDSSRLLAQRILSLNVAMYTSECLEGGGEDAGQALIQVCHN
jgi:hypothetical protein